MADPICTCSYDEGGGVVLRSRTCPYATHASEADSSAPSGNATLYIGLLLGLLLYGLLRAVQSRSDGSLAPLTSRGTGRSAYP